jgi:predicted component of type VI protein secretion system
MVDVPKDLKDAAYVAVGLGLMGLQRAQVRRRELAKLAKELEERLAPALKDLEERLEPVAQQARQAAKETAEQLRSRLG